MRTDRERFVVPIMLGPIVVDHVATGFRNGSEYFSPNGTFWMRAEKSIENGRMVYKLVRDDGRIVGRSLTESNLDAYAADEFEYYYWRGIRR